jgi:hypothetical protein
MRIIGLDYVIALNKDTYIDINLQISIKKKNNVFKFMNLQMRIILLDR